MIEVRGCSKIYPGRRGRNAIQALDQIDLIVNPQEFVCVLGPSGCGKTTLLKIIAGLVQPDRGQVLLDGRPVSGTGRDCGMVFQNFALLPWADVITNVAFGLDLRGMPKLERESMAIALIKKMGLSGFEHHLPKELSGGMQQRVGLARALAIEPKYLLMDEPFGSVDAQTRRSLQEDLMKLQEESPKTVVFITHNMAEAVRLGDRIVLLSARPGRVLEVIDVPKPKPAANDMEKNPIYAELKEYLWEQLKGRQESHLLNWNQNG